MNTTHCKQWRLMESSVDFSLERFPMAILGLILAVLAGAGVWYYRLRMLRDVTSDITDLAGRARGAYRRNRFRKRAEGATLAAIDDPALAAAVLFNALANEDPQSLHKSQPEIRTQMSAVVAVGDLDELLSYAQWAARDLVDPRDAVRRFRPLWREKLAPQERQQLIEMADAVAAQANGGSGSQKLTLDALRTALTS